MIISKQKVFTGLIFLLLFTLAAIRPFSVGTDTLSYVKGYINPVYSIQNRNAGYNAIVNALRVISEDPRFFLIVISFFTQFYIFKSFYKFAKFPAFAALIYALSFYCLSLNILRQFLIISAFYYFGIDFILDRKLIKYTILVLLLFTIHELSLVLFPLYFMSTKLKPKLIYLAIWLVSLAFLVTSQLSGISSLFEQLDSLLRGFMSNLPNYFSETETLTKEKASMNGVYFDEGIFLLIYYQIFYSKKIQITRVTIVLFNIYFVGVIFQNLFFQLDVIQRIATTFLFASIYLLATLITNMRLKIVLVVLFAVLFYFRFVLNGLGGVF